MRLCRRGDRIGSLVSCKPGGFLSLSLSAPKVASPTWGKEKQAFFFVCVVCCERIKKKYISYMYKPIPPLLIKSSSILLKKK